MTENTPTIVRRDLVSPLEIDDERVRRSFQENGITAALRAEVSDGATVIYPLLGRRADAVTDDELLESARNQRAFFAADVAVEPGDVEE